MVGGEAEDDSDDCKFPSVRKTFWRSATWNEGTASTFSSNARHSKAAEGVAATAERTPPHPTRLQEHSASVRAIAPLSPLQPLSIAKRSFDDWPSAALDNSPDLALPITPGRRRVKAGLDIKLDLASVSRSVVEPTEIQLRRDKFALFDKQCSRIINYHIYLGSDAVAKDRGILRANGITHVLNCVGFVCSEYFKGDLKYQTLWLQDSPCEDILSLLYDVFDYFEEVREQGGRVFVHCCQGVSRSTSLVIAYVMWREHKGFEEAFQVVKAARGVANPNMGFACQLLQGQKRMLAAPTSPKSLFRMYKLAPHSPYDPLHLVLKSCINPGVGFLDSWGAFVIHIPIAIYLWIGQKCDSQMAKEAEEAVGQLIRYERLSVPVKVCTEGNEGIDFWTYFTDYTERCAKEQVEVFGCPPLGSARRSGIQCKSSQDEVGNVDEQVHVGRGQVVSSSTDYQMYFNARIGGVIPPLPFTNPFMNAMPTRIPVHEAGWSTLRRARNLAAAKPRLCSEGVNSGSLFPDLSMGSSSPQFSPLSISSAWLSTPAGSDTSSNSPLSSMGTLSPNTPAASIVCSPPFISSLNFASPLKPPAGPGGGKALASSLAERRGSLPPPLQLPGVEDVPPPAPRGMSRKPRLPPLVIVENHKVESAERDCKDNLFLLMETLVGVEESVAMHPVSSLGQLSVCVPSSDLSKQMPSNYPLTAREEGRQSFLYLWPELERISLFDADDLDTNGVFILVESGCHSTQSDQRVLVHVWVGGQLAAIKESHVTDPPGGQHTWHQVGQDFIDQMQLPMNTVIRVVREGHEPEEFWEAFS